MLLPTRARIFLAFFVGKLGVTLKKVTTALCAMIEQTCQTPQDI